MKHLTDQQLMRMVQAGDNTPASELYDRYSERIYNFANRLLRNHELAADATQEVFLRMMKRSHQFKEDASLATWLFAITVNWSRDYFRRAATRAQQVPEELLLNVATAPEEAPDEQLDRKRSEAEAADIMKDALDQLTDEQREAIVLFRYHDLTAREISRIVGCSEGAVKTRIFRGMETIRKYLLPKRRLARAAAPETAEPATAPAPAEETNV